MQQLPDFCYESKNSCVNHKKLDLKMGTGNKKGESIMLSPFSLIRC